MIASPKLRLPLASETAIYRVTERILRADATLGRVVKTWRTWEGAPHDKADPTEATCPFARLSIQAGGMAFYSPSTMQGRLEIAAELVVAGSCLDDLHNLWGAFARALYPADSDARQSIQLRLREAGARTGQYEFSQVAFDPTPGLEGVLSGRAVMMIMYRFDINPVAPSC